MKTGDEDVSLKNILQHQNRLLERLIGQSSGTTTVAEHIPISVYRQFTKYIESWSDYAEQLEDHFKLQGVEKDVQKKQFLLSWSNHRIMSYKDQEGQIEALRIKQETKVINALRKNADIQPRSFYKNQSRPIYRDTCPRCERRYDGQLVCPARNNKCLRCGRRVTFVHVVEVKNRHSTGTKFARVETDEMSQLNTLNTIRINNDVPIIKLRINDKLINMEFDTSARKPRLYPSHALKTYGGHVLDAIGSCKVMATLNERSQMLCATVLDTAGQPLFGRT
ncbi:hypothetical protein GJ496_009563 [Pomphorhynchus laevis]|nr:hypothetical protein GJ496_009563 [Pomphorhynchus laevis]